MFNKYVDVVSRIFRTFCIPGWTETDLEELLQDIIDFKTSSFQAFAKYRVSQLGMQKWHCLEYVCAYTSQVGGAETLYGRIFEKSRKRFKEFYAKTLKEVALAMQEALAPKEEISIKSTKVGNSSEHLYR